MEFFVTFGQRYSQEEHPTFPPAHPDGWLVIEAESLEDARSIVERELNDRWGNLYTKEDFTKDADRLYPRGELGRISAS